MFCPKCGKINPDDKELCSGCGAPLLQTKTQGNDKKRGKFLKIALAVLIVLVVACIIVFLLNGCAMTQLPEEKMTF